LGDDDEHSEQNGEHDRPRGPRIAQVDRRADAERKEDQTRTAKRQWSNEGDLPVLRSSFEMILPAADLLKLSKSILVIELLETELILFYREGI